MLSDTPPPIVECAPQEQSAEQALAQASAARIAGQYDSARCAVERALAVAAENADAWVELGLIAAADGDTDGARVAFGRALEIAPDYDDAKLGMARVEYWSGDREAARTWLTRIDPARASEPEIVELRDALTARSAPSESAWRWDGFAAYSNLSRDLDPWREASLALSYRSGARSIGFALNQVEQFELSDLYGELNVGQQTNYGAWLLTLGGASDPTFRPETSLGLGFESKPVGRWGFDGQLVFSQYAVGNVNRAGIGASRQFNDQLRGRAEAIIVRDELDEVRTGYSFNASWTPSDVFDAMLIWSNAPESSEGVTVDVESLGLFVGAQVTPSVRMRLGVLREERDAYDRLETSLAVTKIF